jgi:polar amino acid transport system substrate-binding protein
MSRARVRQSLWVGIAALALLCAACASNSSVSSSGNASSTQGSNSFVAQVKKAGALKVGIAAAPPYVVQDPSTGNWTGPYADFARYWASQMGVSVDFVQSTFETMVAGIQAGSYQIGMDLTDTPVRDKAITFSTPISYDVGVLIVKKSTASGMNFAQYAADSGNTICDVTGTSYDEALTSGNVKISGKIFKLDSVQSCEAALNAGRADAILYGWTAGNAFAKASSGIGLLFPSAPFVEENTGIGIAKTNPDALAALNAAIGAWKNDPSGYSASIKKWGVDQSPLVNAIPPIPGWAEQASKAQYGS